MGIATRLIAALALVLSLGGTARADFKGSLDWCIGNHTTDPGETNCEANYVATYPECLTGGGRACLMTKAIASAKANDCANAFRLSKICQCHNGAAATEIGNAGESAVCGYLKAK